MYKSLFIVLMEDCPKEHENDKAKNPEVVCLLDLV
jgi:hypothetical protein